MTTLVCLDGATIELKAAATWMFGTGGANLGNTKTISLTSSATYLTVDGTVVALKGDGQSSINGTATGVLSSAAYGVHVGGTDGTGTISGASIGTGSTVLSESSTFVCLDTDTGTFTMTGTPPFNSVPTADPAFPYSGTWKYNDTGGNTKLRA